MKRDKTTEVIRDTFFELTLCLEAIFLIHRADEDLVEAIMRNMEEIYQNATKDMTQGKSRKTYPAIERFLSRLAGGRYAPQGKASN
jgi:hypothetical protein